MNPIDKQPQDLDRWENEGGVSPVEMNGFTIALPTEASHDPAQ
jgi:hypothetical protein